VKRTLRHQVLEYIRYTRRRTLTQPFTPSEQEQRLYDGISTFLMRDESYALPASQRHLTALILRKLLASSTRAVTATLERIHKRLLAIRNKTPVPEDIVSSIITAQDLEDDYLEDLEDFEDTAQDRDKEAKISQELLEQEIEELEQYIAWAKEIKVDGKTTQVVKALDAGFTEMARMDAARKAIIFTESRRTQEYLQSLGANVVAIGDAENKPHTYTAIYDYTGNPYTVQYFVDLMNISEYRIFFQYNPESDVDVTIILGDDWAGNNPMP
jgi:hypothetical protein